MKILYHRRKSLENQKKSHALFMIAMNENDLNILQLTWIMNNEM